MGGSPAGASAAEVAVDDHRRFAFGDHPLGARLAVDDERVGGGLDAVVEAPVFLQQVVQLRFRRGRRRCRS